MKKPELKTLDRGLIMALEGKSQKEILEATGLNYSQLVFHGLALRLYVDPKTFGGPITGDSDTVLGAQIVRARADGQSWGIIAARAGMPEGRVRRIFKDVSAIDSRGLRVGQGGRYVDDDPRFYTGSDRSKLGTELDPQVALSAQVPEPDAPAKRDLPKVAAGMKVTRTRAPRKPRAPKKQA
jgi:hypothetical protein